MTTMRKMAGRVWEAFLAWAHLSDRAVCRMSRGRGMVDFHDYKDDPDGHPFHFGLLQCKRCRKFFMI